MRHVALAAAAAVILALTLVPTAPPSDGGAALVSLEVRGLRGLADLVANILLFVPFGAAAAACLRGWRGPLLAALGLSLGIEVLQLAVPGRFTSPGDVAFNVSGAALGVALIRFAHVWVSPPQRWRAALALASTAAALLVLVGGAALFRPAAVAGPQHVQWTPALRGTPAYDGVVHEASLGAIPLLPGAMPQNGTATEPTAGRGWLATGPALAAGEPLRVRFTTGSSQPRARALVLITDADDRTVLAASAKEDGVIVAWRTRAGALRLDQPDLHVPGILAGVAPGTTVELTAWRRARDHCVRVGDVERCGLGFTLGGTWALVLYPVPGPLAPVLSLAWVALLMVPAGFWLRGGREVVAAAVVAAAMLVLGPVAAGVLPTPALQYLAAGCGLGAGLLLGRAARRGPAPPRYGSPSAATSAATQRSMRA
jgi:hypothetical protein